MKKHINNLVAVVMLGGLIAGLQPGAVGQEDRKIRVDRFMITGNTVISANVLKVEVEQFLLSNYPALLFSMEDLKKVASRVTSFYRKNGYVTSSAYIPAQTFEDNQVEISVLEGKIGEIRVEGEQYFSEDLIRKWIRVQPGEVLDYNKIARVIRTINEHRDVSVESVLVPGTEPETTDIVFRVQDSNPFHVSVDYCNWGTEVTGEDRFGLSAGHTNVFDRGHAFEARIQAGRNPDQVYAALARYSVPVGSSGLCIGAEADHTYVELGQMWEALKISGEADRLTVFLTSPVFDTGRFRGRLDLRVQSERTDNSFYDMHVSGENIRVGRIGFCLDEIDRWGRSVLDLTLHTGSVHEDPLFTRRYTKDNFSKVTLECGRSFYDLPASCKLLLRGSLQYSSDVLAPIEQFQLGGGNSVRGYSEAEFICDKGYAGTIELISPAFLIPGFIRIPFTEDRLKDQMRFVYFVDIGRGKLEWAEAGEKEQMNLVGAGGGVRISSYRGLTVRLEWAKARDTKPADGDDNRYYLGIQKSF